MDDTPFYFLIGGIALVCGGWLISRSWFWVITLGLSTLGALFSILASIIHFQILAAIGFTILFAILLALTMFACAWYESTWEK